MTQEELLRDYREYYAYMEEKYSKLGYETYAGVYRRIVEVLDESKDFSEFNRKFAENNFTLEIGRSKLIDEAKIRKKAYADALIEVKRQYWANDESLVYYNEDEKLAAEARVKMQEAIIETAENIKSFADLSSAMIKANQENALKVAVDFTYKAFNPDIMYLTSIRMYRDAVVNESPAIYPGHPDMYDEHISRLEVEAPKNYGELKTLTQMDLELDYQLFRKEIETSFQSSAQEEYDYSKLMEPRNRRNYPVKDEVIEKWIEDSKEIKAKELKGGSLCQ